MPHAALEFLHLLDPSSDARFNIETYTDKKEKPEPDPVKKRFPDLTREQVAELLPKLEALNIEGAAIYVAVNEFAGQRKIENLLRIRGVHADLDGATEEQLQKLGETLPPTIVVQSSVAGKQHWYWLLRKGQTLDPGTAKAINQGIVDFGADPAAVDVARLLRLPGYRHMKLFEKGDGNTNCLTDPSLCPPVTLRECGPRYSADEIIAALPPKTAPLKHTEATQAGAAKSAWNTTDPKVAKAVEHFNMFERGLWEGNWQGYRDPFTRELPFPSQSEADYYLARSIARWGINEGLSGKVLEAFVEGVFEQSALAKRKKWQARADYRRQTISKACTNIPHSSPSVSQIASTTFAVNTAAQPDWSLKGDLIGARFFKDRYLGKMVFVMSLGKWLRWDDGKRQWVWCELGEHIEAAKATVLELYRIASQNGANNPEGWKGIIAAVGSLQVESRIQSVLELTKSEPGMSILADTMDAHDELLGVRNGVVDLRTGLLRANDPALYITKYIAHDYNPGEKCPTFERFLADVFQSDTDTVGAVQRLIGLTVTGRADEEVLIFCVGTGANGKSIFGNVVSGIMGPYSKTAPSSLLAARRADDHGPRSDLAMLHGARIVSINELPGGMMLDESVTKQLAGREPISARFLYKEHFSFLPRFTPWVRTNHRPIIKGTDNGIWRRMLIVPFRRTFAPHEQDNELEAKLMAEAEGILAWMVEGAKDYLAQGVTRSAVMKAEVSKYRTDSDILGEFLADKLEMDAMAEVKQPALYAEYNRWCDANGLKPISKRALNEQLAERGIGQRKSGSDRFYTGVKLGAACTLGG